MVSGSSRPSYVWLNIFKITSLYNRSVKWLLERENKVKWVASQLFKLTTRRRRGIRATTLSTPLSPESGYRLDPDFWVPVPDPCLQLWPTLDWYCEESCAGSKACAGLLWAAGFCESKWLTHLVHLREQTLALTPAHFISSKWHRQS